MTPRGSETILLAVGDPATAQQLRATAEEAGVRVVAIAGASDEVTTTLSRTEVDAVLLHEDLGPLPVLELVRRLGEAHPTVPYLVLSREVTPELLQRALRAGVRDVLRLPITVEALRDGVASAAEWSRAVRGRVDEEGTAQVAGRIGGRIVAVAGAKGGVGTTTVALQLALAAARADPDRTVCLAELDLQTGDLRSLLDVQARWSVADLVAVGGDVTTRSLDDTLYVHSSGVRVLLAPEQGEDAEDVTDDAMRRVLGALKFQYDLVVCDVGAVTTPAGAVATELAEDVLVVATQDVPSLRAANRLIRLWERLRVREGGVSVVLNRTRKDAEVTVELARRVSAAPLRTTSIPGAFGELEAATNTGAPERLQQGEAFKALQALAEEVGVVPQAAPRRRLRLRAAARAESGQVSVETAGLTGVVLLFILVLWQLVLVGYTFELANNSARAGSRALAVGEPAEPVARDDLPRAWRSGARVSDENDAVKVTLKVPIVIPGVDGPIKVTDTKRTVVEGDPLP
jgi:pilus assembly protein CpaE